MFKYIEIQHLMMIPQNNLRESMRWHKQDLW